jgi:hypothetical protein
VLTVLSSPYGVPLHQQAQYIPGSIPNGGRAPGMPGSADGMEHMGMNGHGSAQNATNGDAHDGAFSQQLP